MNLKYKGDNMKNKNGFTLVEVLAVIAIVGVLMLLIVPNIAGSFTDAKKSIFLENVTTVFESATTTYIYNTSVNNFNREFCYNGDNKLDVSTDSEIYYKLKVNENGAVVEMTVSDNNYNYSLTESTSGYSKNDLNINNIRDGKLNITCN